jgi:calcineurin-like phosphoesterase family protein
VYIVGDLIFRAPKPPSKYLEALNGRKHLLIGNHDGKWLKQVDVGRYFISVNMVLTIMDRNFQVELSHKPNLEFIAYTKDSYHVYGHIHNNTHDDYWLDLKVMTHALNAGVEINHYTPCTLEELIENNNAFKKMLDEKQDISEL